MNVSFVTTLNTVIFICSVPIAIVSINCCFHGLCSVSCAHVQSAWEKSVGRSFPNRTDNFSLFPGVPDTGGASWFILLSSRMTCAYAGNYDRKWDKNHAQFSADRVRCNRAWDECMCQLHVLVAQINHFSIITVKSISQFLMNDFSGFWCFRCAYILVIRYFCSDDVNEDSADVN